MKFSRLTASLLALSLFAMPALAEETVPAAADQLVVAQAAAQVPEEVQALLKDTRPATELSDDELKQRFRQARNFLKTASLPKDVKRSLQAMAKQARVEMAARGQGGAKQQTGQATEPSSADQTQVQQDEPARKTKPIGTQVPDDVMAMLKDSRALSELSNEELKSRVQTARNFIKSGNASKDVRGQVMNVLKAARTEAMARGQKGKGKLADQQTGTGSQTAEEPGNKGATEPDQAQARNLDGNTANPDVEAKAQVYLNDSTNAEQLSDSDLRKRLSGIRELLAGNQLSRQTERALRVKLAAERNIMRGRIATTEPDIKAGAGGNRNIKPDKNAKDKDVTNITIILADRRNSDQLEDRELRRRIDAYRNAVIDIRYAEQERLQWRKIMERDRLVLRDRLIAARGKRAGKLKLDRDNIDIQLGIDFQPGRPPPRDVFAAEIDDEQIEDVLVASPRQKIQRRYTVEEVEASPELRDAVPRIEIDTVRFGFGEAFVREEEVENIDRIAEIMERILTAHPREVFMIEGHTDAVGSDAANLSLSRERAKAIKTALTTYYVIPEDNLETVGYGERYLKIPTAEAEAENRRVSIARATSLLGELEQ
jgi:outer membrane protein OmpA-like peptidoglycan-associated protein